MASALLDNYLIDISFSMNYVIIQLYENEPFLGHHVQ